MGAPHISHEHFTQRLGQLFDLPGSIAVAAAQAKRPAQAPGSDTQTQDQVQALFTFARRDAIVRSALRAFLPDGGVRIRFPAPAADAEPVQALAAERYIAFYAAQQREADSGCASCTLTSAQRLRPAPLNWPGSVPWMRSWASNWLCRGAGVSMRYCSCCSNASSTCWGPYYLKAADRSPDQTHWLSALAQYRTEMQGMLLAEIETRLLPTTGLVEAVAADTP